MNLTRSLTKLVLCFLLIKFINKIHLLRLFFKNSYNFICYIKIKLTFTNVIFKLKKQSKIKIFIKQYEL